MNQLEFLKKWLKKGILLFLLLTVVSCSLISYYSLTEKGWPQNISINYLALALALGALLLSWLIEGWRIRLIAKGLGETIPFQKILGINLAATFAGSITPFNSAGIPTQIYLLCRTGLTPGKASAVVTIRVILASLILNIAAPFLLFLFYNKFATHMVKQIIGFAIPLSLLFSVLMILLLTKPELGKSLALWLIKPFQKLKFGTKLKDNLQKIIAEMDIFHQSIREFRQGIHFFLAILCSASYWIAFFSITPFLLMAFNVDTPWLFAKTIIYQFVLTFVISYLPIPGGSGVMELGFYSILFFVPLQLRAIFIILWRIVSFHITSLIGGLFLLKIIKNLPKRNPRLETPS